MSVDTINGKMKIDPQNLSVNMDFFDFKTPDSLPIGRKSCRYKSTEEKKAHLPTITIMKDNHGIPELSFELSCGKFLNNNNIETLRKNDFNQFIDKLYTTFDYYMDIHCTKDYLKNARLSRYDASIVIDITKYSSCMTILQTLAMIAYPKNIKARRKRYPQPEFDGFSFVLSNKGKPAWRLSVYDKIAEINSSKSNREEKVWVDINGQFVEKTISEALELMNVKQLLRIEFQCLSVREIRNQLIKQGLDPNTITLEALFDPKIATNMILNCWEQYIVPHLASGLMSRAKKYSLIDKALKQGYCIQEIGKMIGYKEVADRYQNGINDIRKMEPDKNFRPYIIEAEKIFNKIQNKDKTTISRTFNYIYKCIKESKEFRFKV